MSFVKQVQILLRSIAAIIFSKLDDARIDRIVGMLDTIRSGFALNKHGSERNFIITHDTILKVSVVLSFTNLKV